MSGAAHGYRVVPGAPEHLAALPGIERAAGHRFAGFDVPERVMQDATDAADFAAAQREGRLWVALSPAGEPVGFAIAESGAGAAHLEEVDVHPDHGRRGVGAALVDAVCAWAAASGHAGVTLTTYRDVPFNAPFYARLGFRALAEAELDAGLRRRVREEASRGLALARRVVMRRDTGDER